LEIHSYNNIVRIERLLFASLMRVESSSSVNGSTFSSWFLKFFNSFGEVTFDTYRYCSELKIHHTTNALDGGLFAPMKMLLKIHRGISIEMKKKLITDYLQNLMK